MSVLRRAVQFSRNTLVRSDDMHEIPNFPFPSQTQQSAAARQELGQPIEMKASGKRNDSSKAQSPR
jgi:hypothetical protein